MLNRFIPKAHPLLYNINPHVEKQFENLVEQGIIEVVSFSDWTVPLVPVMKPNTSLRICGDFKLTIKKFCNLSDALFKG